MREGESKEGTVRNEKEKRKLRKEFKT